MSEPRILIAGIGHAFMGDDAFGCEVIRQLAARPLPGNVRLVDFGIRGMDLAYALMDGCDAAILVDAAPRGQTPGTLYLIEPEISQSAESALDAHSLDPVRVLQSARALAGQLPPVLLMGCEPTFRPADADWELGLSGPVAAAIPQALRMIESLIANFPGKPWPAGSLLGGSHESRTSPGVATA